MTSPSPSPSHSTLSAELAAFRVRVAKLLDPARIAIMDAHINALRRDGHVDAALKPGAPAPAFSLTNQRGERVDSAALLREGPIAVSFFRGTWCPYCNIELAALDRAAAAVRQRGARLVVISPQLAAKQNPEVVRGLGLDILHDHDNQVAKQFGVAYALPDDLRQLYHEAFKNDLAAHHGVAAWELPIPSRFVIARDGTIASAYVDPDYRYRPEPAELLAALDAL
jgi:peroxiredoxin